MKTSIKNLIASSLTTIFITSSIGLTSVSAQEKNVVKISAPTNVKRIAVKGNVEIILVQRNIEGVTYANDNIGTAKIIQDRDLLQINSVDQNPVKLTLYVKELYRIEAFENAIVKTEGKLKTKYLQVFLFGSAHADLNTDTEGLYTVIKENSDLKLSGATNDHILVIGRTPKLTMDKFAALKTNISAMETSAIDKEIASLK